MAADPVPTPSGGAAAADPIEEGRRLVAAAESAGTTVRLLGGVAIQLRAPAGGPLLPRPVKDVDVVTRRESRRSLAELLTSAGYVPHEMFNALHGTRRLLFYDPVHERKLDVFVDEMSMCHKVPLSDRLERHPLTVPLAELVLTKLQIVELTERDRRDILNLVYHHELVARADDSGIEVDFIAAQCAADWGLWRTTRGTIERCVAGVSDYGLEPAAAERIAQALRELWRAVDEAPKSTRWKLRSRVGDRVRWYEEPEEEKDG